MINDCASVGETLLKYMSPEIEKLHIKRTRGFWSKTFGLAYKISRAEGDIFHSNYLLQDCYIAERLGKKPLIGYALGSDLRSTLSRSPWGRIVRHNLKECTKILVSTPDILPIARSYRDDADYLPPPLDTALFYCKTAVSHVEKKRVLIASNANWEGKGTDIAIRALSKLKNQVDVSIIAHGLDLDKTLALASTLGLSLNILPKVPHEKINRYYWNADVVIDQFRVKSPGMTSLEAIACGRPAITYASSAIHEHTAFPLKDVNSEDKIVRALEEADEVLWRKQWSYLAMNHKIDVVLRKLLQIYDSLGE